MLSKEEIEKAKMQREALKHHLESLDTKMAFNEYKKIDNSKLKEERKKMRRLIVQ
jgi:hypothetical protein